MKKYSLEGRKHPSFIYSVCFLNKFRHEKELQHKHIKCLFYLKKGNIALWENSKLIIHFCLRKYKNIFAEVCNKFGYEKK